MAIQIQNLDLEEQEQLDKLKAFWDAWGNLISGVLIVGLLSFAGWRGYEWHQSRQAVQASALYDQVQADAASGDFTKLASSLKLMQEGYAGTTYAQQAGLLAARTYFEKGQADQAKTALAAVAGSGADKGLQSLARLQLASLLTQQKAYDEALKQLGGEFAPGFDALAADRMGDVYMQQGKASEAVAAYTKAYKGLEAGLPYRQMVALKLTSLGVDASSLEPAVAQGAASAASAPASAASSK